jgi:hypothetical protein
MKEAALQGIKDGAVLLNYLDQSGMERLANELTGSG